jgi:hypothetical protein
MCDLQQWGTTVCRQFYAVSAALALPTPASRQRLIIAEVKAGLLAAAPDLLWLQRG